MKVVGEVVEEEQNLIFQLLMEDKKEQILNFQHMYYSLKNQEQMEVVVVEEEEEQNLNFQLLMEDKKEQILNFQYMYYSLKNQEQMEVVVVEEEEEQNLNFQLISLILKKQGQRKDDQLSFVEIDIKEMKLFVFEFLSLLYYLFLYFAFQLYPLNYLFQLALLLYYLFLYFAFQPYPLIYLFHFLFF